MKTIIGNSERDVVKRLAINESGFVFDPVTGRSYTINETGLSVLKRFTSDDNEESVFKQLAFEYGIDTSEIKRDIAEFVIELRKAFQ
jgi:hypothetical protein